MQVPGNSAVYINRGPNSFRVKIQNGNKTLLVIAP